MPPTLEVRTSRASAASRASQSGRRFLSANRLDQKAGGRGRWAGPFWGGLCAGVWGDASAGVVRTGSPVTKGLVAFCAGGPSSGLRGVLNEGTTGVAEYAGGVWAAGGETGERAAWGRLSGCCPASGDGFCQRQGSVGS